MSRPAANQFWMVAVKTILFYGMFLQSHLSECSESCGEKNILFISAEEIDGKATTFPTDAVYQGGNGIKLCFNIQPNKSKAACCSNSTFNCDIEISCKASNTFNLTMDKQILSKHDVVVMKKINAVNASCMESQNNGTTDFLRNIHNCLKNGVKENSIRLGQDKNITYEKYTCKGTKSTYIFESGQLKCCSCEPPNKNISDPLFQIFVPDNSSASSEKAQNIMKNLSSFLVLMGNHSIAALKIGNVTGVLAKLPPQNQTSMNFGFSASGDINILKENAALAPDISHSVQIPKEASIMATEKNSSFAGVLLFPGMHHEDSNSYFLNNEVVGIDMGTNISNLSQTIDIHFTTVTKNGRIASCRSWDGKEGKPNWITDGCETNETNDSITCHCSHLTFFAILMSPPTANISSSDFNSLTSITSAGCGVSMFFLAVALMMHFVVRKTKASRATKILMNLFIAMFFLNFGFVINEPIAGLNNSVACVIMAAVLHYSMLATFTWFFMQALHLYFTLLKSLVKIKHYMKKIVITGWVIPAVVVIVLLALQKYDLVIYTNEGNSAKMCWILDPAVHRGVNIGFYAVVFLFTLSIFISTVFYITRFKPAVGKVQDKNSNKTDFFSILGLFSLLGITWAFAFFAEGPLLKASYYVFTILNSFQGFFLFIYYYRSSKLFEQDKMIPQNACSSATAKTDVESSK
ncbi:adhesion G-protein coupled receptor G2-like [Melanotaenia boesemani]|uniref:adhesion G-protein coupled receptor G2-like n=1 Tax=Melanotaenia boesemani TaxID=1250792 RepID=UPI001C04E5B4|nr:adhesion G-protein coupled receptor G2-like [Melanotaenia boesemani]